MDIEEKDTLNNVVTSSVQDISVSETVTAFKNRALDSSFGAAYFPDVVIQDPVTRTNVRCPPSVAVLGAFALNDTIGHPWFAPAGFTRGALSSVVQSSVDLNRANLDNIYDADINPITDFPGTGVVVWGQKTLLAAASALDRVNVRRLLIDIRRKVRAIANSLLFEPNRESTLEKFSGLVNPILQKIQEQSGLERYKVVIDTTTTTQADIDNNTIRGKIFVQPTRTVEFIALDFVVTNAGAEI
jgi:phage tail sheath protein FI